MSLIVLKLLIIWIYCERVLGNGRFWVFFPGPRHSVSKGSTPVLSCEVARGFLASMDVSSGVGLRDRAIIAAMSYNFARVGAVVTLDVEDCFP